MTIARQDTSALRIAFWPRLPGIDQLGALAGALALGLWATTAMVDGSQDEAKNASSRGTSGLEQPAEAMTGPEWLTAGYFGIPYTYPSDMQFERPGQAGAKLTDLTVHGINWDGKPFKSPIYYGLRSIRWNGSQGTMLDFTHSKTISQPSQSVRFSGTRNGKPASEPAKIGDTFRHLEFSHGHNMLTLNRLVRLGWISSVIQPYAGAGAGMSLPHTEIQFSDEEKRTYEYQFAGPAGQIVAGLEFRLPRVSLFVEYKFTLARNSVPLTGNDSRGWGYGDFPSQLLRWLRGEKPEFGTATTILASHQIIGGLGVRVPRTAAIP